MDKGFLFFLFLLWRSSLLAENSHQDLTDIQTGLSQKQQQLLGETAHFEKNLHDLSLLYKEKKTYMTRTRDEIAKKLLLLNRLGRIPPLRTLVDPTIGQNAVRSIILVRAFINSLKHQMQRAQAEINEISIFSKEIEEKAQSHTQLLQLIERHQTQLTDLKNQKIEDVKMNELERLSKEDDVNTILAESRATLSKKERAATRAAADKGLPFRWLERPVVGRIIKNVVLQKKFNPNGQGIIFETKKNAEVLSPSEGVVAYKGLFQSQGEILILTHGKDVYTVLMGIHKINAGVGQKVYAGEKLGTMAGYGEKPPMLYLELRQQGKVIDPLPYLAE